MEKRCGECGRGEKKIEVESRRRLGGQNEVERPVLEADPAKWWKLTPTMMMKLPIINTDVNHFSLINKVTSKPEILRSNYFVI